MELKPEAVCSEVAELIGQQDLNQLLERNKNLVSANVAEEVSQLSPVQRLRAPSTLPATAAATAVVDDPRKQKLFGSDAQATAAAPMGAALPVLQETERERRYRLRQEQFLAKRRHKEHRHELNAFEHDLAVDRQLTSSQAADGGHQQPQAPEGGSMRDQVLEEKRRRREERRARKDERRHHQHQQQQAELESDVATAAPLQATEEDATRHRTPSRLWCQSGDVNTDAQSRSESRAQQQGDYMRQLDKQVRLKHQRQQHQQEVERQEARRSVFPFQDRDLDASSPPAVAAGASFADGRRSLSPHPQRTSLSPQRQRRCEELASFHSCLTSSALHTEHSTRIRA